MISSLITPLRWYNDIFESSRYSTVCDICPFELITDKTRVLPFQFRRDKSGYGISKWFLRKECEDPALPLFNNNDSLFTIDTAFWSKTAYVISDGKIKGTGPTAELTRNGVFTPGKYYDIKVVVNECIIGFNATVQTNTGIKFGITTTGTFTTRFLAGVGETDLEIVTSVAGASDYIVIESIQVYEYQHFDTGIGDIDLNTALLKLVNVGDKDLISYCGDPFLFQIPCGKYYMIITSANNETYYSELLTVKDFIPSQSPYTMIEWKNNCDLSDVIYQPIQDCSFMNRMYVEGELTRSEYPIKEEGEEDGNQNLNITFQKWEKRQSLFVAKSPEFIVDALTAIRLHDTVFITKSIRKSQFQTLPSFEIEKVEADLSQIFNDCATNVELKLLLKNKIVDVSCCENIPVTGCIPCDYEVDGLDILTSDKWYLGDIPDEDFGLFFITVVLTRSIHSFVTGSPLAGYQYRLNGDQTTDFTVGTYIYVGGGAVPENVGIHKISAVTYDGGSNKTSIQWLGIEDSVITGATGSIKKVTYVTLGVNTNVVCGPDDLKYYLFDGVWQKIPNINDVTDNDLGGGLHSYVITGFTYPGTFVNIVATIYDADTTITTIKGYTTAYTSAQLGSGIEILSSTFGVDVPTCGTVTFQVNAFQLNCEYGNDTFVINYSECYHPVFQAWYNSLTGAKPSAELAEDANAFIQGLDDDNVLEEFDLLHWLAGWETDEQRHTPIISTSSLDFVPVNSPTWDASGVTGDGATSYVNLKWKPQSDAIKFEQDSAYLGIYVSTDVAGDMCDIGIKKTYLSDIFADNNFGFFEGGINDGVNSVNANTGTIGLFSMLREDSMNQRAAKDNTLLPINSTTSNPVEDVEFTIGARNFDGTIEKYSSRQYQFVGIGSKLVHVGNLYTRVAAYKTARGI